MSDTRIATFKTVYGVGTVKEVSELFRADYKKLKNKKNGFDEVSGLFNKYVLAITFLYSIPSIKNNLGIFRKVINEEGGIWKETVKTSFYIFDVYKAVSDSTEQKLTKKEENQKGLEFNVIEEIKRVKTLLDTRTYDVKKNQKEPQVRAYYLAYIKALAGGRRFAEVIKTATIVKKGSGYIFRGILKKDRSQKNEVEANLIALTVDEYRAYTKELRSFINAKLKATNRPPLKDLTESQVNSIFSKVFNDAIKRISDGKVPNFHELRHYYAIEGAELFRVGTESDKDVRYRILGHHIKEDSTRTYKTIK